MNKYLNKNLQVVKELHNEIKINDKLVSKYESQGEVEPITSYKGYSLCGTIDREHAIEVWCEQFKDLKRNEVAYVFGMGSLDYYERLYELYSELRVVIYEPLEELFYNEMARKDYTNLLSSDNYCICVGEYIHKTFSLSCETILNYESMDKPYYVQIPNYIKIFEEEHNAYIEKIDSIMMINAMSRNTAVNYEDVIMTNYLDHLKHIADEATVGELLEAFEDINISDYPAIVLGAGPSLDKNIAKIKDIKGRALIIAVDASANTAIVNGVIPDMIICDDAGIKVRLLNDSAQAAIKEQIPLVIRMQGSLAIRDASKGRKFYMHTSDNYIPELLKEFDTVLHEVLTGGSVGNTAFSVGKMLGCGSIILMGMDLGYPDNKLHTKDAFENEDDVSEEDENYFYVDSIDGGQVLTSSDMDVYREWFETMIQLDPDYKVIDATEGGALIHGAKIMTIDEAMDKYCPTESVDFEGIIREAPYIAEGEERERLKATINKTFTDIDSNVKYLEGVKRDYYKLRDVNEKRRYNSNEFKKLIKIVGEHNEKIENDKDFALYREYCNKTHYEFIDAMKTVYDDKYDEIKNLVKQGLIMLDEYIRAAKLLKEKWNSERDIV